MKNNLIFLLMLCVFLLCGCTEKPEIAETANVTEITQTEATEKNVSTTEPTVTEETVLESTTETVAETTPSKQETIVTDSVNAEPEIVPVPTEAPDTEPIEHQLPEESVAHTTQPPQVDNNRTPDDEL